MSAAITADARACPGVALALAAQGWLASLAARIRVRQRRVASMMPAPIGRSCSNYGAIIPVPWLVCRQAKCQAFTSSISTRAIAAKVGSPSITIDCRQHECIELAVAACICPFDIERACGAAPEGLHLESMFVPAAVTSSGGPPLDFQCCATQFPRLGQSGYAHCSRRRRDRPHPA
jgi:hypothetical protein